MKRQRWFEAGLQNLKVVKNMADSPDTLPGCFAVGKPLAPNKCETCPVKGDCQKYVPKQSLKLVLDKLLELKLVLRGEPVA